MAAAVKWRSSDFNHNLRAVLKGFFGCLVNYHNKWQVGREKGKEWETTELGLGALWGCFFCGRISATKPQAG